MPGRQRTTVIINDPGNIVGPTTENISGDELNAASLSVTFNDQVYTAAQIEAACAAFLAELNG